MTQISIKEQMKKLVELQKIDKEIYDHNKELQEKPAIVAEMKEKYDAKKEGLKNLEEKAKAMQVDRKSKELELQSKEEDISKANTQLSQIKTNKEYTAKITEIENMKADKSLIEEKILLSYDEADALTEQIDKEKKFLAAEEKKYLDSKKEVDDLVKDLQDKVKVLQNKRNQITPEIDKDLLAKYEKILVKKDGVALVPLQGSTCGGCYMNATQQVINEIKMHDKIVVCEMCSRIIYIEDEL